MKKLIVILFLLISTRMISSGQSFNEQSVKNYLENYASIAVTCSEQFHVPASILLAQALVYTKGGTNHLAKIPNNHMAVTCSKDDVDNRYYQDNNMHNICFRKYEKVEESYMDYLKKIKNNDLYKPLFQLERNDYKGWATGLQKIGHSISPNYGNTLIQIIEKYNLSVFDPQKVEMSDSSSTQTMTVEVPIIVEIDPALLEVKVVDVKKEVETSSQQPLVSKVYTIFDTTSLKKVYYPYAERPVYEKDGLKFVIAVRGDSFLSISKSVQLPESHVRLYNDLYDYKYQPVEGEVVYIQKKRKKCDVPYHTIVLGESLRYISQIYGIQLEKILERNDEENIGVGYILCISCKK